MPSVRRRSSPGAASTYRLSPGEPQRSRRDGATVVFVAVDGALAALIAVADPIKPGAAEALGDLKALGLDVVMLTGDNRATAAAVAGKLGLGAFEAEVPPEGKAEVVARLKQKGRVVAMAGDGVNDAPALAAADVGVAMGTGTDVAIESAGLTLLKGDLKGLVRRGACPPRRCATFGRISSSLFCTMPPLCRSPPVSSIRRSA